MHNKFALIDGKVWTGSFNWTKSGDQYNQENVVLIDDPEVHDKFAIQFESLKSRCMDWTKYLMERGKPESKDEWWLTRRIKAKVKEIIDFARINHKKIANR
jgi:phosphatidylserine/phosphatidylglycerophosphate/cardiolipin synthase-like enzyme